MTCREKVQIEYPIAVDGECLGGVDCCPWCYYPRMTPTEECLKAAEKTDEMCRRCWDRECIEGEPKEGTIAAFPDHAITTPRIKDSGNRRQFESGAVRDMQEGKGRCDLMPLEVVADIMDDSNLDYIAAFLKTGNTNNLKRIFQMGLCGDGFMFPDGATMLLEVAKHFEEGAKKYGENNWQKGIPVNCYIDSAVRHYLKWLRGDKDEPHDRAFVWNLMCCIWEVDYRKEEPDV